MNLRSTSFTWNRAWPDILESSSPDVASPEIEKKFEGFKHREKAVKTHFRYTSNCTKRSYKME
jgi:hypothetical protein